MSLPSKIPASEIDNLMSIYWQMLVTLESKCDPSKDLLDKDLVEAGYRILNRVAKAEGGIKSDHQPAWA
jgi:hypothetical protein